LITGIVLLGLISGCATQAIESVTAWTPSRSLGDQPAFNNYLNDPDSAPPEKWETDIYVPVERTIRA
jgi:DNA gyrase inhibitor GyrI